MECDKVHCHDATSSCHWWLVSHEKFLSSLHCVSMSFAHRLDFKYTFSTFLKDLCETSHQRQLDITPRHCHTGFSINNLFVQKNIPVVPQPDFIFVTFLVTKFEVIPKDPISDNIKRNRPTEGHFNTVMKRETTVWSIVQVIYFEGGIVCL